ncbi:MAG: diaminohydroxyphosphoribosylaminopyrimidine deaminase [Lentimonas sp.]|jgi:diaminohydroxyphosphoribosylaminopyrimidine deaminase/5-amino-6-(5-phosphoribosylamino)uracil reductase
MVGAVIVEQGEVVAEGWHREAGQPHAEVEALHALGRKPGKDAIMYVTLEPCSTSGRTGACTNAIVESGIQNVVVGAIDPNPDHAGRGLNQLRTGGIRVTEGILAADCSDLNLIFNHWIVRKQSLIAMKVALTLDGKFAAASGDSKWVTGELARADVMRWRRYFPAIAVGANTVLRDDSSLTSRIGDSVECPKRFVVDRTLKTIDAEPLPKLYSDAYKEQTVVLCSPAATEESRSRLAKQGIEVWELPEVDGHIDLAAFRERCARESIYGIYFEAGPETASSLLGQQFFDYAFVYKAPKLLNDFATPGMGELRSTKSMDEAIRLKHVRHTVLDEDILIRGNIDYA